jgi:hypothetical protein
MLNPPPPPLILSDTECISSTFKLLHVVWVKVRVTIYPATVTRRLPIRQLFETLTLTVSPSLLPWDSRLMTAS